MRPNIDDKNVLFRCMCNDDHFLEVLDEGFDDGCLWMHLIDHPQTLWEAAKRWWRRRTVLWADVGLTGTDVRALRDTLDEWLQQHAQEEPRRGSPQAVIAAIRRGPHLQPGDIDALERAIEEGKLPVRTEGIFVEPRD